MNALVKAPLKTGRSELATGVEAEDKPAFPTPTPDAKTIQIKTVSVTTFISHSMIGEYISKPVVGTNLKNFRASNANFKR